MVRGTITWSSGKKLEFECENADEYLREWFGQTTTIPDGVSVALEKDHAAEEGQIEEGDIGKHPNGDGGRKTAEAGGSDSPVEGGKVEEAEED